MTDRSLDLIRGTLDVLILKTVSWGSLHGYGISRALRDTSGEALQVDEGALYPALRRLERKGLLVSEWGVTDTGRDAKFYRLTDSGEAALASEIESWRLYVQAMSRVLDALGPGGGAG